METHLFFHLKKYNCASRGSKFVLLMKNHLKPENVYRKNKNKNRGSAQHATRDGSWAHHLTSSHAKKVTLVGALQGVTLGYLLP